jgi:elongation factor P hydroxylase
MFLRIKEEVDAVSGFYERHVIEGACILREETCPSSTGGDTVVCVMKVARSFVSFVDVEPKVVDAVIVIETGFEFVSAKEEIEGIGGFCNTKSRSDIYEEVMLFTIVIYFSFAICPEDICEI